MAILVLTYSTELGKFYSQLIGADQLATAAVLSGKIGSGQIGIDHIVSGYPGYRVASGYPAIGLTGAIPEPRISGLIISGIQLSGGLTLPNFNINEDITSLAATVLTPDFGIVDLVDGHVSSGITSSGIETSYTYRLNSVPFLRVYAEADGLGGLQNEKVQLFQQVHVGSLSVPLTTSGGYLTSAIISGWMGYPRLHSGLIGLSNLINPAMVSGLPYANLALSGRLADTDILSGITAQKLLSGYFGYKVASGYLSDGLTGLIPPARISGLPDSSIFDLAATKLTGLIPPARISGLPYANLYLGNSIVDGDIVSGIGANKLLSGYLGFKVTSGYPSEGLVGFILPARISGLPYANLALSGQVLGADISGRLGMPTMPAGTSGYVLTGQGPTVDPAYTLTAVIIFTEAFVASDVLRNSNDTGRSTTATTYTKKKEVLLNAGLEACRIRFDLKSDSNAHYAYGGIYKNGEAIGTERANLSLTYITYSEDFANFASGNLIQIYIKSLDAGFTASTQNMRFYYSSDAKITHIGGKELTTTLPIVRDPTISMTNQDP